MDLSADFGLSIIIPLYNSAETLPYLLDRLGSVLPDIAPHYEIILVNDGSPDSTWAVVEAQIPTRERVIALNMMRNYGQHNALLAGIRQARFPLIVTMDDDLQNPPEELPKLLDALTPDVDVVYGYPQAEQHNLARRLASRITKLVLARSMDVHVAERISAFRVFRTCLRNGFDAYRGPFVNLDVLLTWGTTRFTAVPVRHDTRLAGISNYTFRKLALHALNMMTGFSVLPLQIASWLGFAFTAFGFLILLYVIGRFLIEGGSVPGFPFLASIIALFSGAQLFALGIFGEYLARMYFRTMERPSYVVRERAEGASEKKPSF